MTQWVVVDTLIWASFFSKPQSLEKRAVDDLLDADRVTLIGPIVSEVLLGFRRKEQADWVVARMRHAHFPELVWDDWRLAAELGRGLTSRGHSLPLTDLVIASVALRLRIAVYSTDPHFDLIPELSRYSPKDF